MNPSFSSCTAAASLAAAVVGAGMGAEACFGGSVPSEMPSTWRRVDMIHFRRSESSAWLRRKRSGFLSALSIALSSSVIMYFKLWHSS